MERGMDGGQAAPHRQPIPGLPARMRAHVLF